MNLGTGYLTTAGAAMIARALQDQGQIEWTRCTLTAERVDQMTAEQIKALTTISATRDGTVETASSSETAKRFYLSCKFDNEAFSSGFYCYGFAIWGRERYNAEETLIYVAPKAGETYYMNPWSTGLTRLYVNAVIEVSDAAVTSIAVNQSGGMATAEALQNEINAREDLEAVTVRTNTDQTISGTKTFTSASGVNTTNLVPITAGGYDIGTTSKPWRVLYVNKICQPSADDEFAAIYVDGDMVPDGSTYNLGSSDFYWRYGYMSNVISKTTKAAALMPADLANSVIGKSGNEWTQINVKKAEITAAANIGGDVTIGGSITADGTITSAGATINGDVAFTSASNIAGPRATLNISQIETKVLNVTQKISITGTLQASGINADSIVAGYLAPKNNATLGNTNNYWGGLYTDGINTSGDIIPQSHENLGSTFQYWGTVFANTIEGNWETSNLKVNANIVPKTSNSNALGSSSAKWSTIYLNSFSGSITQLIVAIAPTSTTLAVGQLGLMIYLKSIAAGTAAVTMPAGTTVAGSMLRQANVYRIGTGDVSIDMNGSPSGTFRLLNTIYLFQNSGSAAVTDYHLVLVIRTA